MSSYEVFECEQGSDEWHELRAGLPTASEMGVCFSKKRGTNELTPAKTVTDGMMTYAAQLAADKASGKALSHIEGFQGNKFTDRGHEMEPLARTRYAFMHDDRDVRQVGFVRNGILGASADFLVDDYGCAEIKCPAGKKYARIAGILIEGEVPAEYQIQCQTVMLVCERKWCDFVIYHPDLHNNEPMIFRVERDEVLCQQIKEGAEMLCEQRDKMARIIAND